MANWGPFKAAVEIAVTIVLATLPFLFQLFGFVTLEVAWIVAILILLGGLLVVVSSARQRSKRETVLRDYVVRYGSQMVWNVKVKRGGKNNEEWAEPSGPYCANDLSALTPVSVGEAEWVQGNPFWICPKGDLMAPYSPDEKRLARDFAIGRWNKREKSDWKSYLRSKR